MKYLIAAMLLKAVMQSTKAVRQIIMSIKEATHNNREVFMWEKDLAEAIILQSMEDLYIPEYRKESIEFFRGEGFKICAEVADLNMNKKLSILHYVGG